MKMKKKTTPTAAAKPARPLRRPWRERRPRPLRPDVVVTDSTPLAEIRFYRELTLLTRRLPSGHWASYPISAAGLAEVFAQAPVVTGLLPSGTLGTGRVGGTPFYVLYIPPRRIVLQTPGQGFPIPTPPLIWAGCGADYRIWATAAQGTITTTTPLFVAPFPNCYVDGRICWGNVQQVPPAATKTMLKVLTLFLEDSHFNLHLANDKSLAFPASVLARYADLIAAGAEVYQTDDMLPAKLNLDWVLEGGPWKH